MRVLWQINTDAILAHTYWSFTSNPMRTMGIITSLMVVVYLFYRWFRGAQTKHTVWHPLVVLPRMGKVVFDWDKKTGLGAVDLFITSLDTLGAACIEFETHLIQLYRGLEQYLLAAHTAPKSLYRFIFKK